ncbi:hypothetical protein QQF64_026267 [Cirrhinus molitorella]|uniref:Uncharacterized protein n=1 Tax=Cirrhinus molitorella TaxID=172907 RepID=A0ABR3NRP1_9TELE
MEENLQTDTMSGDETLSISIFKCLWFPLLGVFLSRVASVALRLFSREPEVESVCDTPKARSRTCDVICLSVCEGVNGAIESLDRAERQTGLGRRASSSSDRSAAVMCVALRCVFLCVSLALGACYDSQESSESFEVFVNPYQANAFVRSQRNPIYNPNIYRSDTQSMLHYFNHITQHTSRYYLTLARPIDHSSKHYI